MYSKIVSPQPLSKAGPSDSVCLGAAQDVLRALAAMAAFCAFGAALSLLRELPLERTWERGSLGAVYYQLPPSLYGSGQDEWAV